MAPNSVRMLASAASGLTSPTTTRIALLGAYQASWNFFSIAPVVRSNEGRVPSASWAYGVPSKSAARSLAYSRYWGLERSWATSCSMAPRSCRQPASLLTTPRMRIASTCSATPRSSAATVKTYCVTVCWVSASKRPPSAALT